MRSPLGYPPLIGPLRSAGGSNELKLEPGRRSGVAGAGSAPCPDCAVASIAKNPSRAPRSSSEGGGLFLDYSKNRITAETLRLLLRLAEASGVAARRDAKFRSEKINNTEERAVLHTALRAPCGTRIELDGKDVRPASLGCSRSDGGLRRPSPLRRRCGLAIKELSTLFTRHPEDA
jgi:hypothetical protein